MRPTREQHKSENKTKNLDPDGNLDLDVALDLVLISPKLDRCPDKTNILIKINTDFARMTTDSVCLNQAILGRSQLRFQPSKMETYVPCSRLDLDYAIIMLYSRPRSLSSFRV